MPRKAKTTPASLARKPASPTPVRPAPVNLSANWPAAISRMWAQPIEHDDEASCRDGADLDEREHGQADPGTP